jgi:hypothetical protein
MEKSKPKKSPRTTKAEAQEEFVALLPAVAAASSAETDKPTEMRKASDKTVLNKASAYTVENIIKGTADLNFNLGKALSDLSAKLTTEANKLAELQKAIDIQSTRLKELHDIDAGAVSLKALLETHSERKASFESEMAEKTAAFEADIARRREEWKREQIEHDLAVKERDADLKKSREREQEEYNYALALARKKDSDAVAAREKEIAEKSAVIAARESEFNELKRKGDLFPQELANAVKKAEEAVKVAAQKQAEADAKLMAKEIEGDKRVSALKIASLEEKIAAQTTQLESLTKQLAAANTQVQDIAVKAIEGASGLKALSAVNEIALEQAKTSASKKS